MTDDEQVIAEAERTVRRVQRSTADADLRDYLGRI